VWGIGHHQDNNVGLLCHRVARLAERRAILDQARRRGVSIMHKELMAALLQIGGHWRTHDTQTDESNFCHNFLFNEFFLNR
jgi:hypothetical protein